jgi:putative SOS response-associated peptidase YedK
LRVFALKDGDLFAFAGLWETWKDKVTGEALETYTVITTDPNEPHAVTSQSNARDLEA